MSSKIFVLFEQVGFCYKVYHRLLSASVNLYMAVCALSFITARRYLNLSTIFIISYTKSKLTSLTSFLLKLKTTNSVFLCSIFLALTRFHLQITLQLLHYLSFLLASHAIMKRKQKT